MQFMLRATFPLNYKHHIPGNGNVSNFVSVFDLGLKNLLLCMNSGLPSLTMNDLLFLALTIVALIDHHFVLGSYTQNREPGAYVSLSFSRLDQL